MRVKFFAALGVSMLAGSALFAGAVSNEPSQTSQWGRVENGLQCRVTVPSAIEQGMNVPATVELQADPTKIPVGMKRLNSSFHDAFLTLTLTDAKTGKQFDVTPYSDIDGPFHQDFDYDTVVLERPLKPWKVKFPLVMVYSNLVPADYICRVAFSFPTNLPYGAVMRRAANSEPANWWHGTIISGEVHMRVLPETPREQIFWIPKRLVVTKSLVNLHPSDLPPLLATIPIIRFHKADAQAVSLPVRNGHFLTTEITGRGLYVCGGQALIPDDLNPVDQRYDYKGQDIATDYQIEVIETSTSGGHLYIPGPGSPGYRLIWSKTLHVSITGKEFQRLPATVVDVPAGADRTECIGLIKANPDVEELSLEKARITDADMKLIGKLRRLRVLYLSQTDITDAGLAQLQKKKNLRTLNLYGTKVTDTGVLGLGRLTQLENFSVGDTSVTDKGTAIVSRFPQLKQLDLMNTSIGDATVARLPELKQLEWLDLRGTKVTNEGAQCLTNLVHLSDLRLPNNSGI